MATLRQYFETDFSNTVRARVSLGGLESILLFDVHSFIAFVAIYVPGEGRSVQYFRDVLSNLQPGKTQFSFAGHMILPSTRTFRGGLQFSTMPEDRDIAFRYRLAGAFRQKSSKELLLSRRIYIYSETTLTEEQCREVYSAADAANLDLEFRDKSYCDYRALGEKPLAFICHDSRDKDQFARVLATNLQEMLCPVWYDEFSLKAGANLRKSIETGIQECKKCILILSPKFLANTSWTSSEFESIFLRQVEEGNVIIPIWCGVTKEALKAYSTSLPTIFGLDWNSLGEVEVTRRVFMEVMDHPPDDHVMAPGFTG